MFILKKQASLKLYLKLIPIMIGSMSLLIIGQAFRVGGMIFDLRGVPIYLTAYLWGWRMGLVSAILPGLYRIYLGGPFTVYGVVLDLLIPIFFGWVMGRHFKKYDPTRVFNIKRILSGYFLNILVVSVIAISFIGNSLLVMKVNLGSFFFGILALYCMVLIINDANYQIRLEMRLKDRNQKLDQERKRLNSYLNTADVIFIFINENCQVEMINTKGCQILGYSEDELIGQNWFNKFVKRDEKNYFEDNFIRPISEDRDVIEHNESKIETKSGEERIIIWTNTTMRDDDGQVKGVLSSGLDITRRKLLQEELEYNRLKTEFFANLSHELRTPINLISSALQMCSTQLEKNKELRYRFKFKRYLDIANLNTFRLLKLADNMIDISKINSNHFDLNLSVCDIVKVMDKIVESVYDHVEENQRIFNFKTLFSSKIIVCDPYIIERVILNLISNAVKFTEPDDEITVKLYQIDDKVAISVKDTGPGIPQDKQEYIFDRFRQVDESFRRKQEGSGLGLYIAKALIQLHNGQIELNSEYGQGSEFIVQIPIQNSVSDDQLKKELAIEDTLNRAEIEFSDIYN